jgi:antitoxin FitA
MNKQIHIRDFEAQPHAILTKRAKANNMSLSQYLRIELVKLANRPTNDELFDRLMTREPMRLQKSAAEIIREDRDNR